LFYVVKQKKKKGRIKRCGYSSVVEHLVANENVACSSHVTRLLNKSRPKGEIKTKFLLLPTKYNIKTTGPKIITTNRHDFPKGNNCCASRNHDQRLLGSKLPNSFIILPEFQGIILLSKTYNSFCFYKSEK